MNRKLLPAIALFSLIGFSAPAQAENLAHVQQLLNTRQCQSCELDRAGLIYANLTGVDLSGSSMIQANLSRANLTNANLQQTNLVGAMMTSVNLSGANLRGADLRGADLREAYLVGADLQGARLDGALLHGAVGAPTSVVSGEDYYLWGLTEHRRGNFRGAIAYFDQALALQSDLSHAYLARGMARYQVNDLSGAVQDAQQAEQFYQREGNDSGQQVTVQFVEGIRTVEEADAKQRAGRRSSFLDFLGGVAGLLLQFLL